MQHVQGMRYIYETSETYDIYDTYNTSDTYNTYQTRNHEGCVAVPLLDI